MSLCEAVSRSKPEFFMVYREGGRLPAFKHPSEEAAVAEAKRIARESGEETHVLAVAKTLSPVARPTLEEFAKYAERHGLDGVGLWRVIGGNRKFPTILPVRVDGGDAWHASGIDGVNLSRVGKCDGTKWFPLDASGKDVDDGDGIPF